MILARDDLLERCDLARESNSERRACLGLKARCAFNASEDVNAANPRERHDLPFRLERSARLHSFCRNSVISRHLFYAAAQFLSLFGA
ncbi:hypothetical protein CGSMWGv6420B_01371 [Gardnerella vaginalis 6420B]|nr:hypothetical protein CGSMWGv6420B_01371 [Gardnerella vaginalis 6420B]